MHRPRTTFALLICVLCALLPVFARGQGVHLSDAQADKIGRRLWQNECGGTVSGLTSWNSGENFAPLGIGHFIWYPVGQSGPFEESFPPLLAYLKESGVALPVWLAESHGCPWPNRTAIAHGPSRSVVSLPPITLTRTSFLPSLWISPGLVRSRLSPRCNVLSLIAWIRQNSPRERPLVPNSLTSRWTSCRVRRRRGLTSSGSVIRPLHQIPPPNGRWGY